MTASSDTMQGGIASAPEVRDEQDWVGQILFGKLDVSASLAAEKPVFEIKWTPVVHEIAAPPPARTPQHPALLPCPFCGGEAAVTDCGDEFYISCNDCPVELGRTFTNDYEDMVEGGVFTNAVEAALAWNRRPK